MNYCKLSLRDGRDGCRYCNPTKVILLIGIVIMVLCGIEGCTGNNISGPTVTGKETVVGELQEEIRPVPTGDKNDVGQSVSVSPVIRDSSLVVIEVGGRTGQIGATRICDCISITAKSRTMQLCEVGTECCCRIDSLSRCDCCGPTDENWINPETLPKTLNQ